MNFVTDDGGCFEVIFDGLNCDLLEAVAVLVYKGEVAVGAEGDAGALRAAFADLIVPNSKARVWCSCRLSLNLQFHYFTFFK